jgi:glyoxylase-like metal-dependent hydrolase (beta-lactamase superfamily II)/rhodanese-related sulfurtransferase
MYFEQFFVKGLGCMSYLVGCKATGEAAVIDPDRDVRRYLDGAAREQLRITLIIETHLHADHVSGNTALAKITGAPIAVHEQGRAAFPHQAVSEGDMLTLGNIRLRVRHTPGHTPESISLEVIDTTRSPQPWFVLTGDTLFVGDVGRPDLVGAAAAHSLALDLHHSLFDGLLALDDMVAVYPGHGAGSLCGKSIGDTRSTTIGFERRFNAALTPVDREAFASRMVEHLPPQPGNFSLIKQMNIAGPNIFAPDARAFTPADAVQALAGGQTSVLDLRPADARNAAALVGIPWLPPDEQLHNRIGFVIPLHQRVMLILGHPAQFDEFAYMLGRVGYDQVVGYTAGSLAQWRQAGVVIEDQRPREITPEQLEARLARATPPLVVDVREAWEYAGGHVPGAQNIPLGMLLSHLGDLPTDREVAVICEGGSRSLAGAAAIDQIARHPVYSVAGGTQAWLALHAAQHQSPRRP